LATELAGCSAARGANAVLLIARVRAVVPLLGRLVEAVFAQEEEAGNMGSSFMDEAVGE
jgi:hypothetical protein